MAHTIQILQKHPSPQSQPLEDYAATIHALNDCAQTCNTCADACLSESDVKMLARCIRMNFDCVDVCTATTNILSRSSMAAPDIWAAQLQACALACRICAEECEKHASKHEHCRICAETCRECEQACNDVLPLTKQH